VLLASLCGAFGRQGWKGISLSLILDFDLAHMLKANSADIINIDPDRPPFVADTDCKDLWGDDIKLRPITRVLYQVNFAVADHMCSSSGALANGISVSASRSWPASDLSPL
jgi:hypothetical protein